MPQALTLSAPIQQESIRDTLSDTHLRFLASICRETEVWLRVPKRELELRLKFGILLPEVKGKFWPVLIVFGLTDFNNLIILTLFQ